MPELLKHGDTGLGTFNNLNGEMLLVDGIVYRIDGHGEAIEVPQATRTPFAVAATFKTDTILKIDNVKSLKDLNTKISNALESDNLFYVIRIDGLFHNIRTRSIAAQKKPYTPLIDIIKEQNIFKFNKIKGTMIGIKTPAFIKGIGVAGFHWHFITKDKKAGGHVLNCSFSAIPAKIGMYSDFLLQLPKTKDFLDANLKNDKEKEIKEVEKNPGNG